MARSTLGWLGAALACLLILPSCASRQRYGWTRPVTAGTVEWHDVSPRGSGVRVSMPARPIGDTDQNRAEDGARMRQTSVRAETRYGLFAVHVNQLEGGYVGDPLIAAAAFAEGIFESADLERERSQRLTVQGFYAREDLGRGENDTFVAMRQFVGADRVIIALAVVPRRSQDAMQIASRFMGSIQLDPAHALLPREGARRGDGTWTPLYIPEADFAISMPSAPAMEEAEIMLDGQRTPVWTYQTQDDWGRYRVRVVTFSTRMPDGAYAAMREQLHLQREIRPVQTNGYPGLVFTTDRGGTRAFTRLYQTASRLYVVEAIGPRASMRGHARDLMAYFDSFRIL
ncbi:MAG: hypothetical protein RLO52_12735 [Sandaracinaceae bacterium]|nr:MAG: hypothetical protein EVA89_35365 [Sandaracinaceae bacterium]